MLCVIPALLAVTCSQTFAQTQVVETFGEKLTETAQWRLPKGAFYETPEKDASIDRAARFFRQAEGELSIYVPPNKKSREQFTIVSRFGLVGDFTLKVPYRISGAIPVPDPKGFVNFEITAAGEDGSAHLARTSHGKFGQGYSLFFRPSDLRSGELEDAGEAGKRAWRFTPSESLQGTLALKRKGSRLIALIDGTQVSSVPMGNRGIDKVTFGIVVQGVTTDGFEVAVDEVETASGLVGAESVANPEAETNPEPETNRPLRWLLYLVPAGALIFLARLWLRRGKQAPSPARGKSVRKNRNQRSATTAKEASDAPEPESTDSHPKALDLDEYDVV